MDRNLVGVSLLVLLSWTLVAQGRNAATNAHLCMMNCGQCKEMYGDYFDGRRCAEFCLTSGASGLLELPDCNDPESVDQFLKSSELYKAPMSQALKSERFSNKMMNFVNHPNNVYKSSGGNVNPSSAGNWKKRITSETDGIQAENNKALPRWYFI